MVCNQLAANHATSCIAQTSSVVGDNTNNGERKRYSKYYSRTIILPFTDLAAIKASKIHHQLKSIHQSVEFRDLFIAATCIVKNLPIVTLNEKHFKKIEGLQIKA